MGKVTEKKPDICDLCCKFYHDWNKVVLGSETKEGKIQLANFLKAYESLMKQVLKETFKVTSTVAKDIINGLGQGNWEHLHETHNEEWETVRRIQENLIYDIFYCSDRWSWDRVLRVNWQYHRLKRRA